MIPNWSNTRRHCSKTSESELAAARERFFKIWARLDRKKLRRWMRPRSESEPRLDEEASRGSQKRLSHLNLASLIRGTSLRCTQVNTATPRIGIMSGT